MNHKKKKNNSENTRRRVWRVVGMVCLVGLTLSLCGIFEYALSGETDTSFELTKQAIIATNDAVATSFQQTTVAVTQQASATNTPLP